MTKIIRMISIAAALLTGSVLLTGCSGQNDGQKQDALLQNEVSSIVGQIDQANAARLKSDAAVITNLCMEYYSSVVVGTVNAQNNGGVTADKLPELTDSHQTKKAIAKKCTVLGALQYTGQTMLESSLSDYCVVNNGKTEIKSKADASGTIVVSTLSGSTTMDQIINDN